MWRSSAHSYCDPNRGCNFLAFEPGKDESLTKDNIDEKLHGRISELSDRIVENGSSEPVLLELNDPLEKGGVWNLDANPFKVKI